MIVNITDNSNTGTNIKYLLIQTTNTSYSIFTKSENKTELRHTTNGKFIYPNDGIIIC